MSEYTSKLTTVGNTTVFHGRYSLLHKLVIPQELEF